MLYTSYDEAAVALAAAEQDVANDMGEEAVDECYGDIVESVALMCANADVAAELCQHTLGWMPERISQHFGPTGAGAAKIAPGGAEVLAERAAAAAGGPYTNRSPV